MQCSRATCQLHAARSRGARKSKSAKFPLLLSQMSLSTAFLYTAVVYTEMSAPDNVLMFTYFTDISNGAPQRLSMLGNKIVLRCLRPLAALGQHQPSVCNDTTALKYTLSVQAENCPNSARPDFQNRSSPCCPYSAFITPQIIYLQFPQQSVQSSFSLLVASVLKLVSQVDDGIPQRSAFFHSHLFLPLD